MKENECYPGMHIGKLTLIKKVRIPSGKYTRGGWYCKCDCGNYKAIRTDAIGIDTFSCGCYIKDFNRIYKPHQKYKDSDSQPGTKYHSLYHTWIDMKNRCNNQNDVVYKHYGGRGIKICDEWNNNYLSFKKWALKSGYKVGLSKKEQSLDRIDVNKGYSPNNCRWANIFIQANNKRNTIRIPFHNKLMTCSEIAAYNSKLSYQIVYYRYFDLNYREDELIKDPYKVRKYKSLKQEK